MAIIGLIPARGGSKGITGKNIAMCAGRPLLAYTAKAALTAKCLDRVILSTDDEAIAEVGRACGVDVPFLRPAALANDSANSMGVIVHALDWLESNGEAVEAIVLLQPTSPLRTFQHIRNAVALYQSTKSDALVSVVEVPHQYHPSALMRLDCGRLTLMVPDDELVLRRQDVQPLFARNGPAILILGVKQIRRGYFYSGVTVPFVMSLNDSLDIDTMEDLKLASDILTRSAVA
jgi:CMP-N,N'-diacetyllegionaminic acid synthase